MNCCAYGPMAARQVDAARARRDLACYCRRGPDTTTRLLLEAIRATGLTDGTLLDVGSGIGVIVHELLGSSIGSATLVEVAPAYLAVARVLAEQRRAEGRVQLVEGDAAELGEALPPADLVTLDRVICCYPDATALVAAAATRARRLYAVTLPHDRWYVRVVMALENAIRRLKGAGFEPSSTPSRASRSSWPPWASTD
jgi:SAM-dependent methyltransferase